MFYSAQPFDSNGLAIKPLHLYVTAPEYKMNNWIYLPFMKKENLFKYKKTIGIWTKLKQLELEELYVLRSSPGNLIKGMILFAYFPQHCSPLGWAQRATVSVWLIRSSCQVQITCTTPAVCDIIGDKLTYCRMLRGSIQWPWYWAISGSRQWNTIKGHSCFHSYFRLLFIINSSKIYVYLYVVSRIFVLKTKELCMRVRISVITFQSILKYTPT